VQKTPHTVKSITKKNGKNTASKYNVSLLQHILRHTWYIDGFLHNGWIGWL